MRDAPKARWDSIRSSKRGKRKKEQTLFNAGVIGRDKHRDNSIVENNSTKNDKVRSGGRTKAMMDIDLIFKIAAIGIIVAVLNQVLIRSGREEQAMMTTLAGLIVVLMMVVKEIDVLFRTIKSIFGL